MIEIVVVCEGPTEEAFVSRVMSPVFAERAVFLQPRLIPTSPRAKGGALSRQRVLRYLRNTLKERDDGYVTTLFDLHGLRSDFPGVDAAQAVPDPLLRAKKIEEALHHQVVTCTGCRPGRFLPHIQPWEFEALLFSDLRQFGATEPSWARDARKLAAALQTVKSPEHLNDDPETHPSARLRALRPPYRKVFHGQRVAHRIGLTRIRAECVHFNDWLTRLEALEPL